MNENHDPKNGQFAVSAGSNSAEPAGAMHGGGASIEDRMRKLPGIREVSDADWQGPAWLSPSGRMMALHGEHVAVARKLGFSSENELVDQGFVRVRYEGTDMNLQFSKPLTQRQLAEVVNTVPKRSPFKVYMESLIPGYTADPDHRFQSRGELRRFFEQDHPHWVK